MATNNLVQGVVVWEASNQQGLWDMHQPNVSDFIEDSYRIATASFTNPNSNKVNLGLADPTFNNCFIDFHRMLQCNSQPGMPQTVSVRRIIYPPDSPMACGVKWMWMGDSLCPYYQPNWTAYDGEVQCLLEYALKAGHQSVDLYRLTGGRLPYSVDLVSNVQQRHVTGFKRKVQRQTNTWQYTRTASMNENPPTVKAMFDSMLPNLNSVPSVSIAPVSMNPFSMPLPMAHSSLAPSSLFASSLAPFSMPSSSMIASSMPTFSVPPSSMPPFSVPPFSLPPSSVPPFSKPAGSLMPMSSGNFQVPPAHMGYTFPLPSGFPNGMMGPTSQSQLLTSMPQNSLPPGGFIFGGTAVNGGSNIGPGLGLTNNIIPPSSRLPGSINTAIMPRRAKSANTNGSASTTTTAGSKSGSRSKASAGSSKRFKSSTESGKLSNKVSSSKVNKSSYDKYLTAVARPPADEDCAICCDSLTSASDYGKANASTEVIKLSKCQHVFHRACIAALYNSSVQDGSLQCPTCKQIYGVKHGNCPDGEMEYRVINTALPGFDDCGTITVTYDIRPGKQGPNHPNPGQPFYTHAFPRLAYLPDNDDGKKILRLLKKAWMRRLTFTVGTSVTTGATDTVVWNEIHHKTDMANHHGHGYPDPNYIVNVLAELAAQGVTDEDSDEDDD